MRIFFFLVLAAQFFLYNRSHAQVPAQTESRYKSAVTDYKQGRYAVAMEKLYPMTSINNKTAFSPYAHYYYALSAYQLKRFKESRQILMQLQSRYPGWNRINDAYYLLGAVSLENGQIKEGLDALNRIKESSFSKDVQALKQHHFAKINDLAKLKDLQKQYDSDRDIALVVVQYIESSPNPSQSDVQLSAQLDKQFKFSKKEKVVAEDKPKRSEPRQEGQWTKGYYDVSVLLPFRLDEFSTTKHRSNQFAYDYYLGLVMAKEQLQTEGVTINLWAYDVSNDANSMQSITDNKNFQSSDMVIGPLYPGTFDVAAEFVSQAPTIMLNPLSTDQNLLKASNIYLGHPSIAFQTQRAAQWMKTQSPGLTSAIYYGNTPKDSTMAALYAEEWKGKGGKVLGPTKIQSDREWLESNIPTFETTRPAHIALFSADGASGGNLMEVLNTRKLTTMPVVATSTSFNSQSSRVSKYGARLSLINPDYVDREKESIRQFQKNYWNKTSAFPSVYSYQGYDQLLFFGRMLSKYKDRLTNGLQARKYGEEEFLLAGFDYTKANENQIVPVFKIQWLQMGAGRQVIFIIESINEYIDESVSF